MSTQKMQTRICEAFPVSKGEEQAAREVFITALGLAPAGATFRVLLSHRYQLLEELSLLSAP